MMSRITIRLQRSPSISSVRLIGQPERVSLVILPDSPGTYYLLLAFCRESEVDSYHLHFASGWGERTNEETLGCCRSDRICIGNAGLDNDGRTDRARTGCRSTVSAHRAN